MVKAVVSITYQGSGEHKYTVAPEIVPSLVVVVAVGSWLTLDRW